MAVIALSPAETGSVVQNDTGGMPTGINRDWSGAGRQQNLGWSVPAIIITDSKLAEVVLPPAPGSRVVCNRACVPEAGCESNDVSIQN